MNDWSDWLRARPYHDEQLVDTRVLPARSPEYRQIDVESRLETALADRGVERLFAHQAEAIETLRAGDNLVLATPTASGKSLAYTVPAFERAMSDGATTLYIGPQNALIADQESALASLADDLGFGSGVAVRQYTGRMDRQTKVAVRDLRPSVLLTTPDMLHYGILPHAHRLWDWFLSRLSLVVIDEAHAYRGVFGSHVALILRRLLRLCDRFGADPQVVACSATIGNPREHAATLSSRSPDSFAVIEGDTSATGPKEWAFWNPPTHDGSGHGRRRSNHVEAMRLFVDLVAAGHQTVVFTRSRQTVERYAMESQRRLREREAEGSARRVHAYEAALDHGRRRQIEEGLKAGTVSGVWSTNALELGVDIGGLDAVILDGYPGTRTDTRQRAGRAGRGRDRSLVVVVAGEDQLDQYLMQHPSSLFDNTSEQAVVNPTNAELLPQHLRAAARENWLSIADESYFGSATRDVIAELEQSGVLHQRSIGGGDRWLEQGSDDPHQSMTIRAASDEQISLVRRDTGETLATLSRADAMRDAHRGAIYHHQGQAYEVVELNLDERYAELSTTWANTYTSVRNDKTISVISRDREVTLPGDHDLRVVHGELEVTVQITGFARQEGKTGRVIGEQLLDLPETVLSTEGLFFTVPPRVQARWTDGDTFLGGIHAIEHGLISLFPLEMLCDRGDIGGLSIAHHEATDRATIFVYDGYPGGVGLTHRGFERIAELLARTHDLIDRCECVDGCPACVQSPQCGNGNEPLDPTTGIGILNDLLPGDEQNGNSDTDVV